MRFRLELMQFEIGIATRRYFPASGTAGFERSLVSGNRRLPAPPPMITARTFTVFGADRFCPISPHLLTPLSHTNASLRSPYGGTGKTVRDRINDVRGQSTALKE